LEEAHQALSQGLSPFDLQQILDDVSGIAAGSYEAHWRASIRHEGSQPKANLIAVGPNYFEVVPIPLKFGRYFYESDFTDATRVVIIGESLALELFGRMDPTGQMLKLDEYRFEIIGVLANQERKSRSAQGDSGIKILDRDTDRDVMLPYPSLIKRLQLRFNNSGDSDLDPTYHEINTMIIKVENSEDMEQVRNMIHAILKFRHRGVDDYQIVAPLDLLAKSQQVQDIFNLVMIFIASLSLVVGGIGIMNIMLANIQQRIREIGIRLAIGASQSDILWQFLLEAVLISVGGGIAGIILGIGISEAIAVYTGWATVLSVESILVSFGVSVSVGLIFGFFPARNAATQDPIEALRYE
jgi:putative ABC transport system permease protein